MSEQIMARPMRKAGEVGESGRGWYDEDPDRLGAQLADFLSRVPSTINGSSLPIPAARMIIGPHAGYRYSGPNAAWAYSCLDVSSAKRVFILGPSHNVGFHGCRVTQFQKWATPFGDLTVDHEVLGKLKEEGEFPDMDPQKDSEEHSLELHLPYVYKRLEKTFGSEEDFPKIVPIIVGSNSRVAQKEYGRLLLPYLKDPENSFVISSDFCHWGWYFPYMLYSPDRDLKNLKSLSRSESRPSGVPIHEVIETIDKHAMDAVESGRHDAFCDSLKLTENTVCGRHPIGIAMAALELYSKEVSESRFKVVKYDRSELVTSPSQSSVSYVSAYAVLRGPGRI